MKYFLLLSLLLTISISPSHAQAVDVGVYYFPSYHPDARYANDHGKGWTEWEVLKVARPRFEGHEQPKVPYWGYEDESDPKVMAKKIDAAADHGIDFFIFDWYYYNDGPFLQNGLDKGFLHAENNDRLKFALMWANHDWTHIHPASYIDNRDFDKPCGKRVLYPGAVTMETFKEIVDLVIERYFKHPSYYTIDGAPYYSFYDMGKFIEGLGGLDKAIEAMEYFRMKTKEAGFKDVHLNGVFWTSKILPGESESMDNNKLAKALTLSSITSYVWLHHAYKEMNTSFPVANYEMVRDLNIKYWKESDKLYDVPYYPNVTMGWDSSPRTVQSDVYEYKGYPFTSIIETTPKKFEKALAISKKYLADRPRNERILTINAWNEWTEGSYLEPDKKNKYGYLKAVKKVFGDSPIETASK